MTISDKCYLWADNKYSSLGSDYYDLKHKLKDGGICEAVVHKGGIIIKAIINQVVIMLMSNFSINRGKSEFFVPIPLLHVIAIWG